MVQPGHGQVVAADEARAELLRRTPNDLVEDLAGGGGGGEMEPNGYANWLFAHAIWENVTDP